MVNSEVWQALPEVEDTGGLDPEQYLYNLGNPMTAIAVAMVHAREFRIYRDCLVRYDVDVDNVDSWIETLENLEDVEKVVNHLHVWDIVRIEGAAADFLGGWLADGWMRQAQSQFPERRFKSLSEEGGYGVEMTIWTDRNSEAT